MGYFCSLLQILFYSRTTVTYVVGRFVRSVDVVSAWFARMSSPSCLFYVSVCLTFVLSLFLV